MDPLSFDPAAFSEYPLVGIVVALVVWMMYFFRGERKEMGDRFEAMHTKQTESLDKNTDAITQLTMTNRDVKNVVKELRSDMHRNNQQ